MSDLQQDVRLSAGDEPLLSEYRPVSKLAILAIVLALLSPLALAAMLLWILPVAAVAVAVCALLVIGRPDSGVVGRKGVVAALVLACFFGAWAPARFFSWQSTLNHGSRQYIDKWFDQLRAGQLEAAYQMHMNSRGAPPEDHPPGMENTATADDRTDAEKLFDVSPYDILRRCVEAGAIEYGGMVAIESQMPHEIVIQRYYCDDPETGERLPIRIKVQLAVRPYPGEPRWTINYAEKEFADLY